MIRALNCKSSYAPLPKVVPLEFLRRFCFGISWLALAELSWAYWPPYCARLLSASAKLERKLSSGFCARKVNICAELGPCKAMCPAGKLVTASREECWTVLLSGPEDQSDFLPSLISELTFSPYQGGRGWLAFGDRSRIPEGFRRARICKFSRQKRLFLQLRDNRPFVVVKRFTQTQTRSLKHPF